MAQSENDPDTPERESRARREAEARADAAELDLERAHHLLDEFGVPREMCEPGEQNSIELSLLGRLQLILEEDSDDES